MRFKILVALVERLGTAPFGLDDPSTGTDSGFPDCGVDGVDGAANPCCGFEDDYHVNQKEITGTTLLSPKPNPYLGLR